MFFFQKFVNTLLDLLFPILCLTCKKALCYGEAHLCTHCLLVLPETDVHLLKDDENPIAKKFYGHCPEVRVAALYKFRKEGRIQQLLHQIKYKDERTTALKLGRYYGLLLKSNRSFDPLDLIIPIPLHPCRLRERGYNQSAYFAQGLSEVLEIPCEESCVQRIVHTTTQTQRNRAERLKNMKNAFIVTEAATIQNRSILLVDDLITTGATLEACIGVLLEAQADRVTVAVLAVAI